jgi:hypothetical protein
MSDAAWSLLFLLYIYFGCVTLVFVYERLPHASKEKNWASLDRLAFTVICWPLVAAILIVCKLPFILTLPFVKAIIIINEVRERKASADKKEKI